MMHKTYIYNAFNIVCKEPPNYLFNRIKNIFNLKSIADIN